MLSPEGVPLRRRYYSAETERDLEDSQMVRGYEIEKDRYVVVTDEELEKLAPEKSRDIDMRRFVEQESISPIFFERAYYLIPGEQGQKAYRLLAKTLEDSSRIGIGTFVMRGKEYLVAVAAENGILRAQTLRFADEIRTPAQVGLPEKKEVPKATVNKFEKLITKHSARELPMSELQDEGKEKLLKLVKSKQSRKKDIVTVEEEAADSDEGNVVDLMDVLKKSLAAAR